MHCKDFDLLFSSRENLSPQAEQHLRECDRCRRLASAMGEVPPPSLDPATLERLRNSVLPNLRPVSPLRSTGFYAGVFLVLLVGIAVTAAHHFGMYGLHALSPFRKSIIFSLLALSSCVLAISLARQMRPGSRIWAPTKYLIGVTIGAFCVVFALIFDDFNVFRFTSSGTWCLRYGLLCTIPAGIAFWLLIRRGAILEPVSAGALTGTLAGLVSLTMLELHCPIFNAIHVLAWHTGVVLLSALAGAAIGFLARFLSNKNRARS